MNQNNQYTMLPEAFCERMRRLLGDEAEEFFNSYEKERAYGLRYNPLKFSSKEAFENSLSQTADWELQPVPWCQEGYYYQAKDQPGKHPWHQAGAYYIQEPSAMSVVELLAPKPGEKICDLCAAPGGKTTQIAGKMQGQGLLVANECYGSRAKILAQNVERMGIRNAMVLNESTERLAQGLPEFFDRILVDAPCSGEGMFRKDPQAVSEWSAENVQLCAKRQHQILSHAAGMLFWFTPLVLLRQRRMNSVSQSFWKIIKNSHWIILISGNGISVLGGQRGQKLGQFLLSFMKQGRILMGHTAYGHINFRGRGILRREW